MRPFNVLAKPTGATCNLDCSYCYFLSKEALLGEGATMSVEVLRDHLTGYLAGNPDGEVAIPWQGGEPMLRGIDFFREAVRLGEELKRPGQVVRQAIQTNATLVDDEWAEFFAENGFLVGVSIDGPADLHDAHRVNRAGRGTHDQVVRGWRTLQRHGVETNILCTVNSANQHDPLRVYRYVRDELGARFVQFIPIVERVLPGSVDPDTWGRFLIEVFDEWSSRDVGEVFVQHFDVMLGAVFGQYSLCVHAPECGTALAVDPGGDVYSCDHYVDPDHRLGNLADRPYLQLLDLPQQREFGRSKRTSLAEQCLRCPVRWACQGGCPKDRDHGLNRLCEGYYAFFTHATPVVRRMAELLERGRPASEVMLRRPGV